MTLFVSDVHLGREAAADRRVERDLVAFLRAHERDVERLFLVGDVFDYYIEYRNVVPKGFVRLQGLLAEWADAGISVTYLVGNHDPWHDRYFEDELGVRVVHDAVRTQIGDHRVYVAHGDLLVDRSAFRRGIDRLLRHPVPVWLYKNVLPADLGIFLAQRSSRALGEGAIVEPDVVASLREFARQELERGETDVVILAHSHRAEITRWPAGVYINTGCWYETRTFARLTEERAELCRWDGQRAAVLDAPAQAFQT